MGGAHSTKHDKIIFVTSDGAVGITHEFVQQYVKHMPFEVKQPVLTPRHVAIIQANWIAIAKGTSAFDPVRHGDPDRFFHRTYYGLLFAVMPSCRSIFRSSMHLQGKSLYAVLKAMTSIMDSGDIVERMQTLAARHLKYGCEKVDYTTAGVTLIKTLEIVSGDKWSWEVKEAYVTAFCLILYLMLPVIVHNAPDIVSDSVPATITAIRAMAPQPAKRLTLTHNFPLRFLPGDGVILGIPLDNGTEVKQYFPIASFRPHASHTLDVYVDGSSHEWFSSHAIVGSKLKLYWVESNEHFEVEIPASIPKQILFVSYGIGCAPFIAMMQAIYSIKDIYKGNIVALHCAATPEEAESDLRLATNMGDISHWDNCHIHTGTEMNLQRLLAVVSNADERELYVCGPRDFVAATKEAFLNAGGCTNRIHVSYYDNSKLSRYHEAAGRGLEARYNIPKRKILV